MRSAAADLNFEQAAELRDKMIELKKALEQIDQQRTADMLNNGRNVSFAEKV